MYFYQMTELAIYKLERYPNKIEFIWSIHMIANDKIGQTPAKFENIVNLIIKFGRSLTDFVNGNHMNTPNELNFV